jgi:hypothetical protein
MLAQQKSRSIKFLIVSTLSLKLKSDKQLFQQNESFFLIPKPLKRDSVANADQMWRIDFHKIEAKIVNGYEKMIIKFLKVARLNF